VDFIWAKSDNPQYVKFAKEVCLIKFSDFKKSLANNQKMLLSKVRQAKIPDYFYNVSAEAQFLRYNYGVTAAVNFDPLKGKISANINAELDLALAEGKVTGELYVPNDKGLVINLPQATKQNEVKFVAEQSSLPDTFTFEFNKTFLRPTAMSQLQDIAKQIKAHSVFSSKGIRLQIIGHADDPGKSDYNLKLSKKRAKVVYDFVTQNLNGWKANFESNEWGFLELQKMLNYIGYGKLKVDGIFGPLTRASIKKFQQFSNQHQTASVYLLEPNGMANPKTHNGILTIGFIVDEYMYKGNKGKFIPQENFHTPHYEGHGEKFLLKDSSGKTLTGRNELNRRAEFLVWQGRDSNKKKVRYIPLGAVRVLIEAFLSGYAGANVIAAAEANLDVNRGMMQLRGTRKGSNTEKSASSKAVATTKKDEEPDMDGVGGKISAFIGVKATAGCKAQFEWQCPEPDPGGANPGHTKMSLQKTQMNETLKKDYAGKFVALGSIGYTVTATLGASFTAEFMIGYDDNSNKFLIKAKAGAALGVGCGGSLEFTVGVDHVYYFVTFVYTQLRDHNFRFVDIFDQTTSINLFKHFCAWSYKLLLEGNILGAGVALIGAAGTAIMYVVASIMDWWEGLDQDADEAKKIIKAVNGNSDLLRYTTPEIKGRMLHTIWVAYGTGVTTIFGNSPAENAALTILSWVQSKRDYKNVLKNMELPVELKKRPSFENIPISRNRLMELFTYSDENKFEAWEKLLPEIASTSKDGPVKSR